MNTFLSLIDDGPKDCIFSNIHDDIIEKNLVLDSLLDPYLKIFESKGKYLSNLLYNFKNIEKNKKFLFQQFLSRSITKWIYFTNKIEFSGLETEQETEKCLESKKYSDHLHEKEVLQTYEVLNEAYRAPKEKMEVGSHIIDTLKLKKFHLIMFKDVLKENLGEFRKSGAQTENLDNSVYKFPHHQYVGIYTENLLKLVHKLAKIIDQIDNEDEFICKVIGLASFLQFHFVDIHPFSDGNGRLCRLLSKIILDSIFPIPIPMFEKRTEYLSTLIQGRKLDRVYAPTLLASFIFDVSINYYQEMLKESNTLIYFHLVSHDELNLREKIEKLKLDKEIREKLEMTFQSIRNRGGKKIEYPFQFYDGFAIEKVIKIDFDAL